MYWIYLTLFILVVLTPEIIAEGALFLREEDVESLVIFCFGLFGFALYLAKEKALWRVFQEKLHLQKRAHLITRDLSDSYSYIGGMNRKFDIVKELIFRLPESTAEASVKREPETYQLIIQAVKLLAKTETVSLRFVNMRTKDIEKAVENDSEKAFSSFDAKTLLASKKTFWEAEGCVVVRSPRQAKNMLAYIIFPKVTNRIDDIEVFKILASQALLLFCVDRYGVAERRENK
ncbi:MAG: hypothetical protein Q8Q10_03580 [bacterium]|nr:hypothetical protein [bacterium]